MTPLLWDEVNNFYLQIDRGWKNLMKSKKSVDHRFINPCINKLQNKSQMMVK